MGITQPAGAAGEGRLAGVGPASFVYYYLTSLAAVGGIAFGAQCLPPSPHGDPFDRPAPVPFEDAFANWDGKWYVRIARDGYSYDPGAMSSVAFYPAFPLAGRAVARATGLPHGLALTAVAHLSLWATLALLLDYTRRRFPGGPPDLPGYTALALALCPLSFFCRVAYTESLFLFLTVLVMYGLWRGWPVGLVAAAIGLATATRATGVALIPPLVLAVWQRHPGWGRRAATLGYAVPLSCWGVAAYAAYLGHAFGDPLAFSQAQDHWRFRPTAPPGEVAWAVATLGPIRSAYDPGSDGYWARFDRSLPPEFSLQFANPIYFAAAAALVGLGARRRWLTPGEAVLAAGLLAVPYLTRSYYACMIAHARYAAAAFPVYLVLGQLLVRLPGPVAAAVLALSGLLMAAYAALFAGRFFVV